MGVQNEIHRTNPMNRARKSGQHPPATCILLQGNPKTAKKKLFLFPDGSGSAAAYMQISRVTPDVAIYGLNCPYLKTPHEWTCGPQDLTALYIQEIRKRQACGPYLLGGWSTGGICAFDAAQALINDGQEVDSLLLIDSPCPIDLKRLPPRLLDFLKGIHIFESGGRTPPNWLFPHFEANTNSLQKYRARPFEPYCEPKTHILWARKGVCEDLGVSQQIEVTEHDPKEMKWIMCKREDFGPLGWDRLLNPDDLQIDIVEDANHFSMMRGANAQKVADFVRRAIS